MMVFLDSLSQISHFFIMLVFSCACFSQFGQWVDFDFGVLISILVLILPADFDFGFDFAC
jgi:hypothetical protein